MFLYFRCKSQKKIHFMYYLTGCTSWRTRFLLILRILLPEQKHTHRQCCALGKGFQHQGGECCHFALHRTMVSAAVMITSTVTNPNTVINPPS